MNRDEYVPSVTSGSKSHKNWRSGFSQIHKIANISNFVFLYICSFLHLLHVVLINVELDVSGY